MNFTKARFDRAFAEFQAFGPRRRVSGEERWREGDFVLSLPGGLQNKSELLSHYAVAGHFRAYFGDNWDALNDCLRDFSWITQKKIVIVHDDLPLANSEKELLTYLEILADAVKLWKRHEQHELLIVFPLEAEAAVSRLLDKRKNQ